MLVYWIHQIRFNIQCFIFKKTCLLKNSAGSTSAQKILCQNLVLLLLSPLWRSMLIQAMFQLILHGASYT
jgi:hypothetical protein